MEACWHQNRIKNRCQHRQADFAKSIEKTKFQTIFQVLGVEVRSKNPSKINQTFETQDGSPLRIDFWWILVGFGSQVGRENRAKIDQKSIQKGIKKMIKKRVRLGGVLGAS